MKMWHLLSVTAGVLLSTQVISATFVIQILDEAGEGFNETDLPNNANQKGNNPGTTLGEMRLFLFQAAADQWGGLLKSDITITIEAKFDPLACDPNFGVLGSASSLSSRANFGAGMADTAYPMPLAESLAAANLNESDNEIQATFNSTVDSDPNCLGGEGFYYGLDDNAPDSTSPLYLTVLHELAHGLGFSTLAKVGGSSGNDGSWFGAGGHPDTYSRNLHDQETGKSWDAMDNAERLASSLNDPDLVWKGAEVTADRGNWLDHIPELVVNAPGGIAGTYPAVLGEKTTIVLPGGGITAEMEDGDELVPGCSGTITTDPTTDGKILLFDYSVPCPPDLIAYISETFHNAVGVIIRNTDASGFPDMSTNVSNVVTIPYIGVTQAVGNDLRTNIASANSTITRSATTYIGENNGKVRMHAPGSLEPGSSVSHFSQDAFPSLLMQPFVGGETYNQVDLTVPLFKDIGWLLSTDPDEEYFSHGFETGD